VETYELDDGIAVVGGDPQRLKVPLEGVKCYDDHRVAMSFSVLSCGMPLGSAAGVVIQEKKCVDKTWPAWWDTLVTKFGVTVSGVDSPVDFSEGSKKSLRWNERHVLVLVGMRGAGKTTLGRVAAKSLGLKFIDLDDIIEQQHGSSVQDIVRERGWELFRDLESDLLKLVLSKETRAIISCGGGVVELENNRKELVSVLDRVPVVHLQRNINDIISYLSLDKSRPSFTDDLISVWNRRSPWFSECSNFDFRVLKDAHGDYNWAHIEEDLVRFCQSIIGHAPSMPSFEASARTVQDEESNRTSSFFVSLTFEDICAIDSELITAVVEGSDAVELRVDLLASHEYDFVARQVYRLRQLLPDMPIIYTVRSKSQGGRFHGDQKDLMVSLLESGVRLGCEYVDVELILSRKTLESLKKLATRTRLIGSYHMPDFDIHAWADTMPIYLSKGYQLCDIVKLVGRSESMEDNMRLYEFVRDERCKSAAKPLIAINMGAAGQITRVTNHYMTPVTHEKMPFKAAPGQLSVKQILRMRSGLGLFRKRCFYLFGNPIQHSLSPALHNTGFKELGLENQYQYCLFEAGHISDELKQLLRSSEFGGASVTIPLKCDIISLMNELTPAAKTIGAVNTIIMRKDVLVGDNTDWLGIRRVITASWNPSVVEVSALVVGAGGTARAACYALNHLDYPVKLLIWNRNHDKAIALAHEFNGTAVLEAPEAQIVVSTIPAETQPTLPENLKSALFRSAKGIMVELGYKPRRSELLKMADERGWAVVEGIEILIEQGFEQFERWTGRRPPKIPMRDEVLSRYNRQTTQ
jgi:pentafunctional AROM polypeptide